MRISSFILTGLTLLSFAKIYGQTVPSKNDSLIATCCVTNAEVGPEYADGGEKGYLEFISKNVKNHPSNLKGKVNVHFIIDTLGNVRNPIVGDGLNKEANAEAIRVVKLMKFKPARLKGKKVAVRFVAFIPFQ